MPTEGNAKANPFAMELTGPITEEPTGDVKNIDEEVTDTSETKPEIDDKEAYVPKRLRGKTKEEIIKEFSDLEKDYSRMGNELGESRSLLRETLEKALTANRTEEPPLTDDDFAIKPKEAVQKLIDEAVKPIKDKAATAEQRALMMEFNVRHPNYQDTAKSPEFHDFISDSSYRSRLFKAASNFDMDAAEDLFTAFEEHKKSGDTDVNGKRREIRRASTETGGSGGTAAKSGKKIFKSADLMRLYNTDRERYNEMSEDIKLAFQEGRVK